MSTNKSIQTQQTRPMIAVPSPFERGAVVPDTVGMRIAITAAYDQGYVEGYETSVKRDALFLWWNKFELVAFGIFKTARYAEYMPKAVVKAELEGQIGQLTGSFNEFLSAGRNLGIDILSRFPEFGERIEAIVNALEAVQSDEDPNADLLRKLAEGTQGFEMPPGLKAVIDQGGRPEGEDEIFPLLRSHARRLRQEGRPHLEIHAALEQQFASDLLNNPNPHTDNAKARAVHWLRYDLKGKQKSSKRKREDISKLLK